MPALSPRRQRRHDATVAEIKDVARGLLREGESLNLRAIGRAMDLAPSALYRYFPNRDAIVTALVVDAFEDAAQAVAAGIEQADPEDPTRRILGGLHAFRGWAISHVAEYGLVYGTPVPGYAAPESETTGPGTRVSGMLLREMAVGVQRGIVRVPDPTLVPQELMIALDAVASDKADGMGAGLPASAWAVGLQFWVVLYGAISAEVFGHVPPAVLSPDGAFFDHTMRSALRAVGLDADVLAATPSPTAAPAPIHAKGPPA